LFVFREIIVAVVTTIIAVVVAIYSSGQSLIALMMALLKSSVSDSRASIAAKRDEKKMELSARQERLRQDGASIEQGMTEAQEKADQAMAANTGLWTGVVGAVAQITAGLLSFGSQGPGSNAAGWVGTGLAGMGAGMLGSALFGGLLGFDCLSTYLVLPTGAAFGVLSAIIIAVLSKTQGIDGLYQKFETIGPIQADGSKTGSAGSHKGKDLE